MSADREVLTAHLVGDHGQVPVSIDHAHLEDLRRVHRILHDHDSTGHGHGAL